MKIISSDIIAFFFIKNSAKKITCCDLATDEEGPAKGLILAVGGSILPFSWPLFAADLTPYAVKENNLLSIQTARFDHLSLSSIFNILHRLNLPVGCLIAFVTKILFEKVFHFHEQDVRDQFDYQFSLFLILKYDFHT